jgi:hypothetical protein
MCICQSKYSERGSTQRQAAKEVIANILTRIEHVILRNSLKNRPYKEPIEDNNSLST